MSGELDEAVPTPLDLNYAPPADAQPTTEEALELREEAAIASLTTHPGWQLVTDNWKKQIMSLRTLANVDMVGKSDAEVGQLTRAYHLAADRMEQELVRIEVIAEEVHEQGEA